MAMTVHQVWSCLEFMQHGGIDVKEPISELHGSLDKIGRERNARRLNRVANHPEVRPYIGGPLAGKLDFTAVVQDPRNILLMSQHGGMVFHQLSPGIYDAHIAVVPEGRGKWALNMTRACFHWMFTRTDALEIMARIPKGNVAARAMATAMGMKPSFATQSCSVLSITVQQWAAIAPGLVERGQWVATRMGWNNVKLVENEDPEAYRHIGLAFEMFLSG